MKFSYSVSDPSQSEFDNLPRLTFLLSLDSREVEATGLVDSGATVNVLPYSTGIRLGEKWDDSRPYIRLTGNMGNFPAIPLAATAKIGDFRPVHLMFAWVKTDAPLILGQTNFFMEFDVYFYRSKLEFELMQKLS
uniref:Aspartyl protease n=1 Tax=Candidatus Kentrum sp. LPFa TaxID=2126335 RepID=A0A450Y0U1_9GAMM|nr:MAG: hypothetical protein BECKLPF1236A_GA0070988_103367 [Candidatus Kentron sp. LPFa]VFK35160.1 MAG: hypothetical protein BECKLPF1236C_GA0070990_103396 [Candidatus Kentron sp. LPFa]